MDPHLEIDLVYAILLGAVQGLTEFLPISSSGHLVVFQTFLELKVPLLFDVFLHFATLLTVIFFFRNELVKLTTEQKKIVILASLPIFVVGAATSSYIELLFEQPLLVAALLAITGYLNWSISKQIKSAEASSTFPSRQQALKVGLAQACALLPGISRAGVTLWATRPVNFSFAFILAIPAISGAFGYQLLQTNPQDWDVLLSLPYLVGGATAFGVGNVCLYFLKKIIRGHGGHFKVFAVYCWIVSLCLLFYLR